MLTNYCFHDLAVFAQLTFMLRTQTDRYTDHATTSVEIGRMYAMHAMWPKNNTKKETETWMNTGIPRLAARSWYLKILAGIKWSQRRRVTEFYIVLVELYLVCFPNPFAWLWYCVIYILKSDCEFAGPRPRATWLTSSIAYSVEL